MPSTKSSSSWRWSAAAAGSSSLATAPSALPSLSLSDGAIEALKWLGLVLMTLDHVNKYLLHDSVPVIAGSALTAPIASSPGPSSTGEVAT